MTHRPRALALAASLLVFMAPAAQASIITDFLDRIGGCRKPMSDSFSYEISPYTPKPYGKALAEWTNDDLADFRAYFVACQTRRPDWQSMGDYNRNDAIRVIDTVMAELRPKVAEARATAERKRSDAAYEAEKRSREEDQRRAEAEAAAQRVQADGAAQAERTRRNDEVRQKALPLLNELLAFMQNEIEVLPFEQKLARLDGYIARMEALGREIGDVPAAKPLLTMLEPTRTLRDQLAAEQARQATAAPPVSDARGRAGAGDGPYTDFEWMGQRAIMALTNPLQGEDFRASLSQGIDFNVGVSGIEPAATGWMVHLSGRLGSSGTPGQGFFCRVDGADTASLAVLRTVTPPYGIIHVTAPRADEYLLNSNPLRIRIVFSPCRISAPDNGPRRSTQGGRTGSPAAPSTQGATGSSSSAPPVAPSPPDLRCLINPSRRGPEQAMAHRLRQVWAIPEALRDDPSLWLTFAVTLNFDAEMTEAPKLLRSTSQRATPEQLQAAVEAAHRAIRESAPFPELGQLAGGTMQVDMTPCD